LRVPVTAQGALPAVIWPDDGEGTTDKGRDQGLRYIENGMPHRLPEQLIDWRKR